MSAARHSSPPPPTAAVLEYLCLFTHDLRRKQKRWQDGRLKYHSFNKRVMVYDDYGTFIGDMHWRRDYDFDEGEEMELERGGVIVQVSELVERRDQDLSELLGRRVKEKEQRQLQAVARSPAGTAVQPRSGVVPRAIPRDHFQLNHRPLHQLIEAPMGHLGRAFVPKQSPFEQRQQRPEAAKSPDERVAKRRNHDDQAPSKSGYAHALFGQALTLSATPLSSVPVRLPALEEPSSSASIEVSTRAVGEEPAPALREQPKSSHHFNQPAIKPQTERPEKHLSTICKVANKTNEAAETSNVGRRGDRRLHPNHRVEHAREFSSASDDAIEIDEPQSIQIEHTRQPRAQKEGHEPAKARKQIEEGPRSILPRQNLMRSVSIFSRSQEQNDEQPRQCTVNEGHAKAKKGKPAVSKPAAKHMANGRANSRDNQDDVCSIESTRKRLEPVTELRIKSSKKRGLLMMSDAPKKPRDQTHGKSTESHQPARSHRTTAEEDDDDPFRSPSPEPHARRGRKEAGKKSETAMAQRTNSTVLGETEDFFLQMTPPPQERTDAEAEQLTKNLIDESQRPKSPQLGNDTNQDSDPTLPIGDDMVAIEHVACIYQAPKHRSSPQREVYDPYRLLSSPKEQFVPLSWSASSPVAKIPSIGAHPKDGIDNGVPYMEEAGGSATTATKRKKQRLLRRNVVLEDNEELEPPSEPRKRASADLADNEDAVSEKTGSTPNQPRKRRKTTEVTERVSKTRDKSMIPESEEEQPPKHRKSTRQKRNRVVESEETSQPSEQDCPEEEEQAAKKRRKDKTSKASGSRPHLAKIKNSVKSRELIGFSLAALNAPLAPRGIGVPFSILSLPVNESVQRRRTENHATVVKSSETVLDGEQPAALSSDPPVPVDEPHEVDVDENPAAVPNERERLRKSLPPVVEPEVIELQSTSNNLAENLASLLEVHSAKVQIQDSTSTRSSSAAQDNRPANQTGSFGPNRRHGSTPGREVSIQKEPPRNPIASEQHPVIEQEHMPSTVQQDQEKVQAPRATTSRGSIERAVSTVNSPTQKVTPASRRQPSTAAGNAIFTTEAPSKGSESTVNAQTTRTLAVAAAEPHPLPKPTPAIRKQSTTSTSVKYTKREAAQARIETPETAPERPEPDSAAQPPVSALIKKPTPANRQQTSTLTCVNDPEEAVQDKAKTTDTLSRVDVSTTVVAKPSVNMLVREPKTALRRQPTTTAKLDSANAGGQGNQPDTAETIQFDPASAITIQRQKSFGLRQTSSASRRINNITAQTPRPQHDTPEVPLTESVTTKSALAARIVNPATRGRKAALKSHAAGQVPQRVLPPTQPTAVSLLSSLADASPSTRVEEPPKAREPEKPKKKMTFPGFQSVATGPWSREAYDLLESGKPD